MGSVPILKPHEVENALHCLGFELVRQRGSHRQYRQPDGQAATVPIHRGRDIAPALLRQIAKDVGISVDELAAARKR